MPRTSPPSLSRRQAITALGLSCAAAACANNIGRAMPRRPLAGALQYPVAAAVDSSGATIYIADLLLPGIWKVVDGKAAVFYKAEKKYRNPLFHPRALAVLDKDVLLVSDTAARDLFLLKAGEAPKGLTQGKLDVPAAILQIEEDFYVADTQRNEIWKGTLTDKWSPWAKIPAPRGLALGGDDQIWIVSGKNNVLYSLKKSGGKPESIASGEANGYWTGVAIAKDGVAVVVDAYAKTLWRIESGKPVAWVKGDPVDHPVHITKSGDNFLVTDSRAKALIEVTPEGITRTLQISPD